MNTTTPPRQRNLQQTRRLLLDAARTEVAARGAHVSLDAISRTSGVSKGGLLHHFPTKESMLLALADDLYQRFERTLAEIAASEPEGPGHALRAYVRATFRELAAPDVLHEHGTLLNLIATVPAVSRFVGGKLTAMQRSFAADGIAPDVVRLVMLATDGAAVGMVTAGPSDSTAHAGLENQLLTLISQQDAAAALLAPHTP
ncbi:TetR/AcrR family transcriptional regulator [Micrococcales bacterium 31B]|nr:TetR/AcrR family transcriptional regulator [Micrococcales bacterium 31B]